MSNPLVMALLLSKMLTPTPAPKSNTTKAPSVPTPAPAPTPSSTSNLLQMMMMMQGQNSNPLLSMMGGGAAANPWARSLALPAAATSGNNNNAMMMSLVTSMMANNNNGGGGGGKGKGGQGRRRRAGAGGKAMRIGMGQPLQAAPLQLQGRSMPIAGQPIPQAQAGGAGSVLGLSQSDLASTRAALGGQAGIDAIYAQLGGKERVMEMIRSGQGLPPGFVMPAAITNLGTKIDPGQVGGAAGGYDYEYYDPDTGAVLPPLTSGTFSQYPAVQPPSTTAFGSPLPTTTPPIKSAVGAPAPAVPQSEQQKASSILNAVGGQKTLNEVFASIGGQAGIDAIYEQLGGRDNVMRMIQSGQGLPANFKLPSQLADLGNKLQSAAQTTKGASGGGYDYEYYYVDDLGNDIGGAPIAPVSSPFPPASAPIAPAIAPRTTATTTPVTPSTPLFAPPNPSFVAGGGSLFDFLNEDEPVPSPSTKTASSIPSPAEGKAGKGGKAAASTSLADKLAAAQTRVIG